MFRYVLCIFDPSKTIIMKGCWVFVEEREKRLYEWGCVCQEHDWKAVETAEQMELMGIHRL